MSNRQVEPQNSKKSVTKAGNAVRNNTFTPNDLDIIENWRMAHNKVLNDWQSTLRKRINVHQSKGFKNVILAQRQKRKATIFDKLKREPHMALSRMQDIAGCRLIFDNMEELNNFRNTLNNKHTFQHNLVSTSDYITETKFDGYRGIHDIWKYQARPSKNDKWNDLRVEIQYRTKSQHLWATAVEIADLIKSSRVKFGQGSKQQKRFFLLASDIITRVEEHKDSLALTNQTLVKEFLHIDHSINMVRDLHAFKIAANEIAADRLTQFASKTRAVILIYKQNKTIECRAYGKYSYAQHEVLRLEKTEEDIVLVKVNSIKDLRLAYTNYFGDSESFLKLMLESCKKLAPTTLKK